MENIESKIRRKFVELITAIQKERCVEDLEYCAFNLQDDVEELLYQWESLDR